MKKITLILMAMVALTMNVNAQWSLQTNPLGSGDTAMVGKIQFVSATEGWIAASRSGSLLHTTDGGTTWNVVNPFPADIVGNMSDPATTMSWTNSTHGWALKTYIVGTGDITSNGNGAVLYNTTDGGSSWAKKEFPKTIATITYSTADLQGTWQLHEIVAKNPSSGSTNQAAWMHGTITLDGTGSGNLTNLVSNGQSQSDVNGLTLSISTVGLLTVSDNDMHGFMSADKSTMIITSTENGGGYGLLILQRQVSETTYTTADLQGSWQMHVLSVGDNAGAYSGWGHGTMTGDASGNFTGNFVGVGGSESYNTNISISSSGIISGMSSLGPDAHGFMSADKKTIYLTMTTSENSDYNLATFQRQATGTTYSSTDLQGYWQMHSIVADNIKDTEPWSSWTHAKIAMDAGGNGSLFDFVVNNESRSEQDISISISTDGILTGFGSDDSNGFMSTDKSIAIVTTTDAGSGGYTFGIMQKDLTVSGDIGLQVQFVDNSNGWASNYNTIYGKFELYKTTNGGSTWNTTANTVGGIYYFVDANNGWMIGTTKDNIGEGNLNTIYHTTDGGSNWVAQASSIGNANDLYFTDLLHGWVVGKSGLILKTTDGGTNWTPITNAGLTSDSKSKCVFFLDANTGWIGTHNDGENGQYVLATTDGGVSWTSQSTPADLEILSLSFWDATNGWFTGDYGQIAHYTAPKTVNVSAGGLSSALTSNEKATLSGLTITGTIDARDFKIMRDDMPLLAEIDLSQVSIAAYSGLEGTYSSDVYSYPANTLPRSGLYNKASLASIKLPVNLTAIGRSALNTCTGLSSVVIPSTVVTIDTLAFRSSALTHIVIPSSVETIGYAAFYDCAKLTSVEFAGIPTVSTIGVFAFGYCKELTQIDIPSSTTFIGDVAFLSTQASVNVDANNPNYSSEEGILFDKDKTVLMYCPQTFFGYYTVPSTVKTIGVDAFYGCSELYGIYLPESLETINEQAFLYCSNLYSLTIPDGVSTIQREAFYGCSNLQSMYIPESVTTIGYGAFGGNSSLSSIDVSPNNAYFASVEGVLFDKSETKLLAYPGAKGSSYSIPDGVTCIEPYAFVSSYNLEELTIPSTVSQIGYNAFDDCYNLSRIYVESVTPVDLSSSADVFLNVDKSSCVLSVPIGSKTAYQAANQWSDFQNIVETGGTVTYNVTVPDGTKVCYIAGEMNDWTQQAMTKVDDTHYTLTIQDADITQQYKYCSGPSWDFQEMDANGNYISNRSYTSSDVVANWKAVFDPSTLTAADYYLPLRVGNYTRLRTNNDYTLGWAQRTTTYSFKRTDQINGESYILEEGWEDEFDGCDDCMEGPFRYLWIKKDNEGNIVLGAYAVEEEEDGELSDNLASAYILGEPTMWFPNTFLTVGATLKFAISDTEMSIDSVMSVTATAGSYSNCILVRNIERTTSGIVTFMEDHYYAYQLGLVKQDRLIPAGQAHTDYITGYLADSPTAIKNSMNSGSSVSVYPNPTTDGFYVNAGCTRVDVSVCTVSGTILFTKQVDGTAQQKVSISGLPKGIYLLKLQTPDGTVVRKLVKE